MVELSVGVALGLLLAWQALVVGVNDSLAACLGLCIGGIMTFFVLLAAHELGHLLAGLAMGLPFVRFTVGPLQVVREGGLLRARFNTAWFQPAAYVMHGLGTVGNRRFRRAVMVLGGPLSNVFLAGVCFVAASGWNPGPPVGLPAGSRTGWRNVALFYPGDVVTAGLNVAAVLSLGLAISTLVPGRAAGLRTDGGQLLDLWRASPPPNPWFMG
jgi:hypothetical protein